MEGLQESDTFQQNIENVPAQYYLYNAYRTEIIYDSDKECN